MFIQQITRSNSNRVRDLAGILKGVHRGEPFENCVLGENELVFLNYNVEPDELVRAGIRLGMGGLVDNIDLRRVNIQGRLLGEWMRSHQRDTGEFYWPDHIEEPMDYFLSRKEADLRSVRSVTMDSR